MLLNLCVSQVVRFSSLLVMMETPVGIALREIDTSSQWSTLTGVLTKVNRKLPANQKVDTRTLTDLLVSEPAESLARYGVWITQFGDNYLPIELMNRPYARKVVLGTEGGCSCGFGGSDGAARNRNARFFGSQDYNAGRHGLESSGHLRDCLCWTPPTSGHLHSWRRGFDWLYTYERCCLIAVVYKYVTALEKLGVSFVSGGKIPGHFDFRAKVKKAIIVLKIV